MTKRVDERGGVVSAALGRGVQRAKNKVLSKFGNTRAAATARGKLTAQNVVKKLRAEYFDYLGQQAEGGRVRPSLESLIAFMRFKHGFDITPEVNAWREEQTKNSPAPQQAPPAEKKPLTPDQQKMASELHKMGVKVTGNTRRYQDETFNTVMRRLQADSGWNADKPKILALVKELVDHAKDHGGDEEERVKLFLNLIASNPKWASGLAPDLENLRQMMEGYLASFANYLVENVRSRKALAEAYSLFFEETMLNAKQLDAILFKVASKALTAKAAQEGPQAAPPAGAARSPSEPATPSTDAPSPATGPSAAKTVLDIADARKRMIELGLKQNEVDNFLKQARTTNPLDLVKALDPDTAKKVLAAMLAASKIKS